MQGQRSNQKAYLALLPAAVLIFFTIAGIQMAPNAFAEDAISPDTPVSSDGAVSPDTPVSSDGATSGPVTGQPPSSGTSSPGYPATSPSSGAEASSQVKVVKTTVSHEQERKDRLFVDATFIAVAIVLLVIAFFLFMSLPKQAKKAGNDSVR